MSPSFDDLWYRDGLRFTCTRCGKCCTGEPGFVWINEEEIQAIAAYREEDPAQFDAMYTKRIGRRRSLREKLDGDCVFYDREQGCTIYPVRPRQCRTWPFWESNVRTPKDWQETCAECPGAGQGELISVDEIVRRVQVLKI